MDSEPKIENQEKPASEAPVAERPASAPAPANGPANGPANDNRRRRGRGGRGRFSRGRSGERNDRGGERTGERNDRDRGDRERSERSDQPRNDAPRSGGEPQQHRQPAGSIGRAMEQVEQIRSDLKKTLEDLEEVLSLLDQIERDKNASEDEIEALKDSLASLHRGPSYPRSPRSMLPSLQSKPSPQPQPQPHPVEPVEHVDTIAPETTPPEPEGYEDLD
jgi:hypothetical protein